MVTGVGWDRAAAAGPAALEFFDLRRVVTNLCVFDFGGPDHRLRLVSVHPGVSVDEVVAATGFSFEIASDVAASRLPTDEELRLITEVIDPTDQRHVELPEESS